MNRQSAKAVEEMANHGNQRNSFGVFPFGDAGFFPGGMPDFQLWFPMTPIPLLLQ
jgi:hypothetical protein